MVLSQCCVDVCNGWPTGWKHNRSKNLVRYSQNTSQHPLSIQYSDSLKSRCNENNKTTVVVTRSTRNRNQKRVQCTTLVDKVDV